jgi:hypothetical protein
MKKIGVLLIVLVVVLGSLGVAYAAWAQDLTIKGTVDTTYLSASFDTNVQVPVDPHGIATVTGAPGKSDPVNKDAAGNELMDVLNITVEDAYPGYDGIVTFYVDNNGGMPMYVEAGDAVVTYKDGHSYDTNGNTCSDVIGVTPGVDIGAIVYPGNYSAPYTLQISIPLDSNPVQNSTYYITVPLTATQYLP